MAKSANFASALKKAQGTWKKAKKRVATEERKTGYDEFPDGRYMARLIQANLATSEAGNLQTVIQWKFIDGDYEDSIKHQYQQMASEDNMFYFGRMLEDFGYELPDDLADIEAILKEISKAKPVAKIRLKTRGDFQNVFIDKLIDEDEEEGSEEEDESEEDESEDTDDAEETEEESDDEEDAEEESDEEEAEESDEEDEEEEEEEEAEDDDDVDEEADLQVGMDVIVNGKTKGKVIEIIEKEGKARIRTAEGKVIRASFEKLELDETPPEEPKTKTKKTKASAEPPAKTKTTTKPAATKKKR